MSRQKPKRCKAYTPKPVNVDSMSWALAGSHLLPDDAVAKIMAPLDASFLALKRGVATRDDWNFILQAMKVVEALAGLQIGPNLIPKIDKAMKMLAVIALRMCSGSAACKAPELAAITEGILMYRIQLKLCTQGEFSRALARTKELHRFGAMKDVARIYEAMAA